MPPLMVARQRDKKLLDELSGALAGAQVVNGWIFQWAVVDDRHLDPIIGVVQSLISRRLLA